MRMRSIGVFVAGVIVGSALGVVGDVTAQAQQLSRKPERMTRTAIEPVINADRRQGLGNTSFLKDAKSGGCWLYVTDVASSGSGGTNLAVALAPAPKSACDAR